MSDEEQRPAPNGAADAGLGWLLDDLVDRVADIDKALILSRDGLVISASREFGQDDAEHLSAIAASFQSLARGASERFGGGSVRQAIIEMDSAFLFVTAAGQGSCLAVLSPAGADVGLVAYEMAILVKRVGPHLAVAPRPETADGSPA